MSYSLRARKEQNVNKNAGEKKHYYNACERKGSEK